MATLETLQPPSISLLNQQTLLAFILKKRQDRREMKEVKRKVKRQAEKPAKSPNLTATQTNELIAKLEELLNG